MQFRRWCLFVAAVLLFPLLSSAAPAPNLKNVIAYPNPYKPSVSAARVVTFSNVTDGTITLKIFNLAGELIYSASHDGATGSITWDVTDDDGDPVASGLYIYLITDSSGHKAKGKLAVLK